MAKRSPRKAKKIKEEKKLIYCQSRANAGIVFAAPDRAKRVDKITKALDLSGTWGEFKKAMPADDYEAIINELKNGWWPSWHGAPPEPDNLYEDDWPKSNEPFDSQAVPGVAYNTYPPWLQQEMLDFIPSDLIERFCESGATLLDGDFCNVPMDNLDDFCAALTELGFEVEHAPELNIC